MSEQERNLDGQEADADRYVTCNSRRPHSSFGWKTPAAYAADWRT